MTSVNISFTSQKTQMIIQQYSISILFYINKFFLEGLDILEEAINVFASLRRHWILFAMALSIQAIIVSIQGLG